MKQAFPAQVRHNSPESATQAERTHWRLCAPCCNLVSGHAGLFTGGVHPFYRIPGSEPLKPLLLNHHMDVVAADATAWTHPPFSGAIVDGFVWGRGTLDTKNLGVIFLLALESLVKAGARFRRQVVFSAVPDEETGGKHGMRWLVEQRAAELTRSGCGMRGVAGSRICSAPASSSA
ncbi:MAG: M20/M25/M40 family metallo-hydrolase [Thiobacillaceae bacterium]